MYAFRLVQHLDVVARERATVAITRELHKWQLLEAAGRANEPLPRDHVTLIEQWVEALA